MQTDIKMINVFVHKWRHELRVVNKWDQGEGEEWPELSNLWRQSISLITENPDNGKLNDVIYEHPKVKLIL
jgi:hypothetical protein